MAVEPLWTYSLYPAERPTINSVTCRSPTGQYYPTTIITRKSIYTLSPSERLEDCHIRRYSLTHDNHHLPFPGAMGSRHAIWTKNVQVGPFLGLQSCAYPMVPEGCDGVQRFGHVGQVGVQVRPLQLPVRSGSIWDISWDEESGRLCVLISQLHMGVPTTRLLVVDLI